MSFKITGWFEEIYSSPHSDKAIGRLELYGPNKNTDKAMIHLVPDGVELPANKVIGNIPSIYVHSYHYSRFAEMLRTPNKETVFTYVAPGDPNAAYMRQYN